MFGRKCCCQNRQNMMGFGMGNPMGGNVVKECQVVEPTITKCVEEECYHEIPQV